MKFIDEKGRLGGKLSVIDLCIVLILIAVAVGAYLKFNVNPVTNINIEQVPVRYTVEIAGVRDWAMHNIRVGDAIFFQGANVGTITSVTARPHQINVHGDEEAWWGYVPDRFAVLVEVEATGTDTDGRIRIHRVTPMGVGNSPQQFTTRYAEFQATVLELTIDE